MGKQKVVDKTHIHKLKINILGSKIKNGEIYVQLGVDGKNKWIRYSICSNYAKELEE